MFLGHIIRGQEMKNMLTGRISGRRSRGRQINDTGYSKTVEWRNTISIIVPEHQGVKFEEIHECLNLVTSHMMMMMISS